MRKVYSFYLFGFHLNAAFEFKFLLVVLEFPSPCLLVVFMV